jgi:hypothetical protein
MVNILWKSLFDKVHCPITPYQNDELHVFIAVSSRTTTAGAGCVICEFEDEQNVEKA